VAGIELLLAYALDLLVGDPPHWPHPVRGLGKIIGGLEGPLRRLCPEARTGGIILAGITVAVAGGVTTVILKLAFGWHSWLGGAVSVVLLALALAVRDLAGHAQAVYDPLAAGDLNGARQALSRIVGRDTAALDEAEVIRATVESVAENTVDGVISPLFYGALGGPVLAWIYKAASTLDSMVGYTNERYREFGWAGARLDDLMNWLPARLSGIWFTMGAWLAGLEGKQCWRMFRRDGRKHLSPNAGFAEAAMSGALGLRLGGPGIYGGRVVDKPFLGDGVREPKPADIIQAVRLLYATSAVTVGSLVAVAILAETALKP